MNVLPLESQNHPLVVPFFGEVSERFYYQTTFYFNEPIVIDGNEVTSHRAVTICSFDASEMSGEFVDIYDETTDKLVTVRSAIIKHFERVPFDAKAYNETIENGG